MPVVRMDGNLCTVDLSKKNVILSLQIETLFESFEADAPLDLLFLKNLQDIELYRTCGNKDDPKLLYKVWS